MQRHVAHVLIDAQGPGTRDQGPGTRDQGPGTRDQGPGTRDQGPGTRDQGPGTRDQGPGTRDQGPGICLAGGDGGDVPVRGVLHQGGVLLKILQVE